MTFEELNLNSPLQRALDDLDFVIPTPIQEKAFPVVMSGRNLIGIAQTGTGKTFAYLLPIIRQLTFSEQREPRILILAPTHELVIQIFEETQKLIKYTSHRALAIYGGANINIQKQKVYDGTDILISTPGRLYDLAMTGVLRLKSLQKLVVDEVDEMFSQGFRHQLVNVLELLPVKRQTLMFSATLTPDVELFIDENILNPEKIEIAHQGTPVERIYQAGYLVPNFFTKISLLHNILADQEMNKVLIFAASKRLADRVYEKMNEVFEGKVGAIHSNKAHNTRLSTLGKFVSGEYRILIATDIIARGMDINNVSHVINFDIPSTPVDYIHRIGRTGRADKDGIAISLINRVEEEYIDEIQEFMSMELEMIEMPSDVEISNIFADEELPARITKPIIKQKPLPKTKGAFHEKLEKNKKVNLGGLKRKAAIKRKKKGY